MLNFFLPMIGVFLAGLILGWKFKPIEDRNDHISAESLAAIITDSGKRGNP